MKNFADCLAAHLEAYPDLTLEVRGTKSQSFHITDKDENELVFAPTSDGFMQSFVQCMDVGDLHQMKHFLQQVNLILEYVLTLSESSQLGVIS